MIKFGKSVWKLSIQQGSIVPLEKYHYFSMTQLWLPTYSCIQSIFKQKMYKKPVKWLLAYQSMMRFHQKRSLFLAFVLIYATSCGSDARMLWRAYPDQQQKVCIYLVNNGTQIEKIFSKVCKDFLTILTRLSL